MLLYFALAFLAAAAYFVGEVATQPARDRRYSLRRAADYGHVHIPGAQRARFRERVVLPLMERLAALALKLNPRVTVETINARLLAAGLGRKINAQGFLAAKGAATCGGLLLGFTLGGAATGFAGALIFGLMLGALGFVLPGIILHQSSPDSDI